MSIWAKLSAIDCNKHTEKKGKFTYLSWTWAWAMVKENYPDATYKIEKDKRFPDDTVEVRMTVTIEGMSQTMWLPVMDMKNAAIANPDATEINKTRMRCLVKCCAMFGLGHYIFAGESFPEEPGLSEEERAMAIELLANGSVIGFSILATDLGESKMAELYNSAPHGHKVKFKEEISDLLGEFQAMITAHLGAFMKALADDDGYALHDAATELDDDYLKGHVWARLSDTDKHRIKSLLERHKKAIGEK